MWIVHSQQSNWVAKVNSRLGSSNRNYLLELWNYRYTVVAGLANSEIKFL